MKPPAGSSLGAGSIVRGRSQWPERQQDATGLLSAVLDVRCGAVERSTFRDAEFASLTIPFSAPDNEEARCAGRTLASVSEHRFEVAGWILGARNCSTHYPNGTGENCGHELSLTACVRPME